MLIDTHCHCIGQYPEACARSSCWPDTFFLMTTRLREWDIVAAMASSEIVPSFGIHPWYVDQHLDLLPHMNCHDRLDNGNVLIQQLDHYRNALSGRIVIGEIGLDFGDKYKHSKEAPIAFFKVFMEYAGMYRLPVSVHCVKAHGFFLEYLTSLAASNKLPSALIMHSYSGSAEMTKSLVLLSQTKTFESKLFFSFSNLVNGRSLKRTVSDLAASFSRCIKFKLYPSGSSFKMFNS